MSHSYGTQSIRGKERLKSPVPEYMALVLLLIASQPQKFKKKKKKNQEISTEVSKTVSTLSSKASHVMSNLPSYLPLPTCESSQTKEVFHLHCVLKQLLLCSDCPHSPPQPQTFRLPPSHPRVVYDLHYEACPRH